MMWASRRSAFWQRIVAVSLIGLGVANCSGDSGRLPNMFGSNNAPRNDPTGSIPQSTPAGHVDSRPLPHLAGAEPQGSSGGGQRRASYQPNSQVTGSPPPAPLPPGPPPAGWTWECPSPTTAPSAQTPKTISRQEGLPVSTPTQGKKAT